MHESAIAHSLVEMIMTEAIKQSATPVSAKISCGTYNAVNNELLCFAFEAISRETVCDGMKLEIEYKPIQAKCGRCDKIFDFDIVFASCPDCGGDFDLLPDKPLVLESIEFEEESSYEEKS